MKMLRVLSIVVLTCWLAAGCTDLPPTWGQPQTAKKDKAPQPAPSEPVTASEPDAEALTGNTGKTKPADDETIEAVRKYLADLDAATAAKSDFADNMSRASRSDGMRDMNPASAPEPVPTAARTEPRANQPLDVNDLPAEQPKLPARPVVLNLTVSEPQNAAVTSNDPADVGANQSVAIAPAESVASLEKLIELSTAELEDDPANAAKQWELSLLHLAADEPDAAAEVSPAIAEESRELITRSVAAVEKTAELLENPITSADEALVAVNRLREQVRQRAELSIPTVTFCSRVTSFGVYDELPDTALMAYQPNRVIVYTELENFHSELDESGLYRTNLETRLELFSDAGESLWVRDGKQIEDVARRQREDFFLPELITLPSDIGPGDYVLKVTVTDLVAGRSNEANHRFTIAGMNAVTSAAP